MVPGFIMEDKKLLLTDLLLSYKIDWESWTIAYGAKGYSVTLTLPRVDSYYPYKYSPASEKYFCTIFDITIGKIVHLGRNNE